MLIVQYRSTWQADFERLKNVLTKAISNKPRVEHIGSTSVEGLAAKPIIDIDIAYKTDPEFESLKQNLVSNGYAHVGDQGIKGREVFKRNAENSHAILDKIPHHLYACHEISDELRRHLFFRDNLRNNAAVRAEYQRLKMRIAQQANQDKKQYAKLKEEKISGFIESILVTAIDEK